MEMLKLNSIISDIKEFMHLEGKPEFNIEQAIKDSEDTLVVEWNNKESIESFYMDTYTYIANLAGYNTTEKYTTEIVPTIEWLINKFKAKTILDFGCGIGTLSFYLDSKGYDVTSCDVPSHTIDFYKFRQMKHNRYIKTRFTSEVTGKFDMICLVDVIGHIENIDKFIPYIVSLLNEGGIIFANADFNSGGDEKYPMHFVRPENFSKLLYENGLEMRGDVWFHLQ